MRPDGSEHGGLRLRGGVNVVGLKPIGMADYARKQKRDQHHALRFCNRRKHGRKTRGVRRAVVWRNLHADQQNARARLLAQRDHTAQIVLRLLQGKTAQGVIAAQLDDDHARLVAREQGGQTGQPARCGVAADAGVDHGPARLLGFKPLAQQIDPAFSRLQPVSGRQAVAHHEQSEAGRYGGPRGAR